MGLPTRPRKVMAMATSRQSWRLGHGERNVRIADVLLVTGRADGVGADCRRACVAGRERVGLRAGLARAMAIYLPNYYQRLTRRPVRAGVIYSSP